MADYSYLTSKGVVIPDTSNILGGVQADYRAAFGQDLVVTPDTPQGVLITAQALSRTATVQNNADLANQINPDIAGGPFLDAIMRMTGMQRTPSSPTRVLSVLLTGVPNTVISAGSQAATTDGYVFSSISTVTLDSLTGQATVDFQSDLDGPIVVPPNSLTQIVTNVLGWETVDNANAGILGATTQSDLGARTLRNNTLAFQSVSLSEAITSALYNVAGVTSLQFRENVKATSETIDGILMDPHSVYVCVKGGTDLDVAAALLENKSSGAAWNGDTEVTVIEPASGQPYEVKFDRPEDVGILIRVTTPNGDPTKITQAVLDWANNLIDGLQGFAVGVDVSCFEIAAGINQQYPETYIQKVEISLTSPISYSTDSIAIGIDEIAYTEQAYITVVP